MSPEASSPRPGGRAPDALRPTKITLGAMKYAEGSALVETGETRVLCAASIENGVPPFLRDSGSGWLTAEYAMLPRATHTRARRERTKVGGRSAEIQRLIGRSLRAAVDLKALGERTLTVDCDVIQADGGTRTASITGAWVAMVQALGRLYLTGDLPGWPLSQQIAAVSVGLLGDLPLLDLEYTEDRDAQVDMNVVGTAAGELVEIQGTAEGRCFSRGEADALLDLAMAGIAGLAESQHRALAPVLEEVAEAREARRGSRRPVEAKAEKDLWGPPT